MKEYTRGEISKNYFSQPLKSGEARASPASPVPTPLTSLLNLKIVLGNIYHIALLYNYKVV